MRVTSPSAGVPAVPHSEWQKETERLPRKTNTTHIKWERALRLTVQLALTKNLRYIFTDCYRKRSKWISAIHSSTGLQSAKGGFAVIILCQYAELALCPAALLPELQPAPCFLSDIIGQID